MGTDLLRGSAFPAERQRLEKKRFPRCSPLVGPSVEAPRFQNLAPEKVLPIASAGPGPSGRERFALRAGKNKFGLGGLNRSASFSVNEFIQPGIGMLTGPPRGGGSPRDLSPVKTGPARPTAGRSAFPFSLKQRRRTEALPSSRRF